MSTVFTAAQVGQRWNYTARTIRELSRSGQLPPPIDPTLTVQRWRWSLTTVELYEAGNWKVGQGAGRSLRSAS